MTAPIQSNVVDLSSYVSKLEERVRSLELTNARQELMLEKLEELERDVKDVRSTLTKWGAVIAIIGPVATWAAPGVWKLLMNVGTKGALMIPLQLFHGG